MRRKHLLQALLLALTLALMLAVLAVSASASETADLDIYAKNLSFENEVHLVYAVKSADPSIKLYVWTEDTLGGEPEIVNPIFGQDVDGVTCTVFKYTGIAAKEMTDNIYVQAVVTDGETETRGALCKYSILQYAYNKLGKTDTATTNTKLIGMLNNMLAYGASAQEYHGYKTGRLATDDFVQITLTAGTLSDGFTSGLFVPGSEVTVIAAANAGDAAFTGWQNAAGVIISSDLSHTLTVGVRNTTYAACYGAPVLPTPEEYLAFTLLEDGSYSVAAKNPEKLPADLTLPATFGGKAVTAISYQAFKDCSNLVSVVIPDSVTDIGASAFAGCSKIESLTAPFIGAVKDDTTNTKFNYLFGGSSPSALHTVTVTGGTFIGDSAFAHMSKLTSIQLPDSIESIGSHAFYECRKLESIDIPSGVTGIGDQAFSGCKSLTNITIGDNVKSIGTCAFMNCTGLTSISIGNGLESVGERAFEDCPGITQTENGISYVDNWVIACDNAVVDAVVRAGTEGLATRAFYDRDNLKSVLLPDGVRSIGDNAFSSSNNLTTVTIPASVKYIGSSILTIGYDPTLTDVYYGGTLGQWHTVYDTAHNDELSPPILHYRVETTPTDSAYFTFTLLEDGTYGVAAKDVDDLPVDLVIPSSYNGIAVTHIADKAFRNATELITVVISDSVKTIGVLAFSGCVKLVSMTTPFIGPAQDLDDMHFGYLFSSSSNSSSYSYIPDSLRVAVITGGDRVGNQAFYYCDMLTTIILPDSIKSIGTQAFDHCTNLTDFTIPDGVREIGDSAFYWCTDLTSIKIPTGVTGIGYQTFASCSDLASVEIPDSVKTIGDYAFYKCHSLQQIEIPNSVESIGEMAFYDCNLTSIAIPGSVKTIGYRAFEDNNNLASIELGNGVKTIGDRAFVVASSVTDLVIPDSVTDIGEEAFSGCSALISISIGSGVEHIGIAAFNGCSGIIQIEGGVSYVDKWVIDCDTSVTKVKLRAGTVGIADHAFDSCTSLVGINIPQSVKAIGASAFYRCSALTDIVIPDGVTVISKYAFQSCENLESVYIPEGVTYIGAGAFWGCSSLTSIDLPDGVTYIGEDAFYGCSKLTIVTIPAGVTRLYAYTFAYCNGLTSIVLGSNVTYIEDSVFAYCTVPAIYYTGTPEQWAAMTYNSLDNVTVYFYSSSTPPVVGSPYPYWHYVNGVPTPWGA